MNDPRFERAAEVADRTRLGLVVMGGAEPALSTRALDEEIERAVGELRRRHEGASAGSIPHLAAARKLYRAFSIDPTKHRPSPEALTRRVLRGDAFPRVHPAVDLANLWALVHGRPVGLYEAARIAGPRVTVRLGRPGEFYAGIRKPEIRLEGRPVVVDDAGPFGNPTADSARTAVGPETTRAIALLFAPIDESDDTLRGHLAWLESRAPALLGWDARARLV
jgi:DNA/RNA-binding domain of Phe-tRNA-synthetase-like protein